MKRGAIHGKSWIHGQVLTWGALLLVMAAAALRGGLALQPAGRVQPEAAPGALSRVVVVDAGHGGPDGGATGVGGVVEEHVTLAVAKHLGQLLSAAGFQVIYTRAGDHDLSGLGPEAKLRTRKRQDLIERVRVGNGSGAAAFLSIHANMFPSSRWSGAQTFYDRDGHPDSRRLAESVQAELVALLGTDREANFRIDQYLLKNLSIPAATVEVGFLSNPEEARRLQDEEYQRRVAWAVFVGFVKYWAGSTLPGTPPLTVPK